MSDLLVTRREDLERLCDVSGRLGLAQLPLFRAAADGQLALLSIQDAATPWPARLIERNQHRPTCFLIGGDPGLGYPDPSPSEWACAKRLKYWCQNGGAVVHGSGASADHYREAAHATVLLRRVAFIETTSARAPEWVQFLGARRTLLIVPKDGPHPIAAKAETVQ